MASRRSVLSVASKAARRLIFSSRFQSVTWLTNNLSGQTKRATGSAFQIGIGVRVDAEHNFPERS